MKNHSLKDLELMLSELNEYKSEPRQFKIYTGEKGAKRFENAFVIMQIKESKLSEDIKEKLVTMMNSDDYETIQLAKSIYYNAD